MSCAPRWTARSDPAPTLQSIVQHTPLNLSGRCAPVRKVIGDLGRCRTAALGGHVAECDHCHHRHYHYHSCRNRHCPQCQSRRREAWVEARIAALLPVPYFHVVFTLPHRLNPLIQGNPRALYHLLFVQAARTLQHFARRDLQGRPGITLVLHTWGQNLSQHVHVHCLVTAGALTHQGRWRASRSTYLFPGKALRRWFRRGFLDGLKALHGELRFAGKLTPLAHAGAFNRWLTPLYQTPWGVYAKAPFAGPEQLIRYLGRYTHRTAISNNRIVAFDGKNVTFRWRDYADGDRVKSMQLPAPVFIERFLLHVLPRGMPRIRHYGLHANRAADARATARRALNAPPPDSPPPQSLAEYFLRVFGHPLDECPRCHRGRLIVVRILQPRARDPPLPHAQAA